MFRDPAADAFAPEAKTGRLEFAAHDRDDFAFDQPGAFMDFLKGGAIFPSEAEGNLGSA